MRNTRGISHKENECGYSDEWQPYKDDYDKFEYDVKLKDGTIVLNCYPNGGSFNSISDEHNGQGFSEKEVVEIRFSNAPRFGINEGVSDIPQYEWIDKATEDYYKKKEEDKRRLSEAVANMEELSSGSAYTYHNFHGDLFMDAPKKVPQYRRESPKVHRNDPCTCGSGKKFKKCCINK